MLALKKALTIIALTVTLLAVSPAAHAQAQGFWGSISSWLDDVREWLRAQFAPSYEKPSGDRAGVPELDPSAAGGAIVLLVGGVAYIASRRREEDVTG